MKTLNEFWKKVSFAEQRRAARARKVADAKQREEHKQKLLYQADQINEIMDLLPRVGGCFIHKGTQYFIQRKTKAVLGINLYRSYHDDEYIIELQKPVADIVYVNKAGDLRNKTIDWDWIKHLYEEGAFNK